MDSIDKSNQADVSYEMFAETMIRKEPEFPSVPDAEKLTAFNARQLALADPDFMTQIAADRELAARRFDDAVPFASEVMEKLRSIAKEHDLIIVTPSANSRYKTSFLRFGQNAGKSAADDLVWISLEQTGLLEKAVMKLDKLKPRTEETDNTTRVFVTHRQFGKAFAQEQYRRGGFADIPMDRDMRSRSERRGHQPKKQLKGQDYLSLRKGY